MSGLIVGDLLRLQAWPVSQMIWFLRICLQFVIVVFPDHAHLLLLFFVAK